MGGSVAAGVGGLPFGTFAFDNLEPIQGVGGRRLGGGRRWMKLRLTLSARAAKRWDLNIEWLRQAEKSRAFQGSPPLNVNNRSTVQVVDD